MFEIYCDRTGMKAQSCSLDLRPGQAQSGIPVEQNSAYNIYNSLKKK